MISVGALLSVLVSVIIVGLIFYLLWWALGKMGLPEPFNKIATVILVLVTVIVLIGLLMGLLSGAPTFRW
jgi:heme A synthase